MACQGILVDWSGNVHHLREVLLVTRYLGNQSLSFQRYQYAMTPERILAVTLESIKWLHR